MGIVRNMKKLILPIRVFFTFSILLGLLYPLFVLLAGQIFFPYQANGSIIKYNGKEIGSSLIAQEFTLPKYFHSRFSAVNYNATNSGGTDLAPSNKILYEQVKQHIDQVRAENKLDPSLKLPANMVLSSGSGLDPHISLRNALLQLPRVIENRHLSRKVIRQLINKHLDLNFIGIWGKAGVNVLQLNLALDKLEELQH